jgi:HSP20 family protein
MTMQRWRSRQGLIPPIGDLYELRRRIEDFWPGFRQSPFGEEDVLPAIDMYEKEGSYIVKAEIPGMKEEDIDVSISGDRLAIKGEKKTEQEVNEDNYYRRERSYGSFTRYLDLPPDVEPENIEASYENGILEITVPKSSEVKAKKIKVSAKKKE